jgi:hypothetical protein
LRNKKAAIFRQFPFTIILKKSRPDSPVSSLRLHIDPGAKFTGMALVNGSTGEVVFTAELKHRGFAIRDALTSRRQLRRSRRARKTRYRQPRFLNRTRLEGWLAPSLQSRIDNIKTWVERLRKLAPIEAISQELVRFDMQLMANPDIQGQEYQQGTLAGYETREYLITQIQYYATNNQPRTPHTAHRTPHTAHFSSHHQTEYSFGGGLLEEV